jgi:Integrase core domain
MGECRSASCCATTTPSFSRGFDDVFMADGAKIIKTPVQAPKANAFAERWVRTVRAECLDWTLVLGRRHLLRLLRGYIRHYNEQRPHRSLALAVPEAGSGVHRRSTLERSGVAMCSAALSTSITRWQHDESGFPCPTGIGAMGWRWPPVALLLNIPTGPEERT